MSRVKIIEFPQPQPIRFKDDSSAFASLPQTVGNEKDFAGSLNVWDIQKGYCQKWQFWDTIGIQIQVGAYYTYYNLTPFVEVLDVNNNVIATLNPAFSNTLAGNTHQYKGQTYGLVTYNWLFSPSQVGIFKRGVYRFRVNVGYLLNLTPVYDTYTSEPQLIAKEHERTVLFRYKSTGLKNDVDWTNMQFQFRVEAIIGLDRFESNTVGYRDQQNVIRQQQSKPSRMRRLYVGKNTAGVPAWAHDVVNYLLASDEVYIQNKRYVRDPEDELTLDNAEHRYKLLKSSVAIQEFDLSEATRSTNEVPTTVFIVPPTGFPFCVKSLKLTNGASNNTVNVFEGYAIHNATQLQDFIKVLNSYRGGGTLTGSFGLSPSGDTCLYYNGVGESFDGGVYELLTEYTAFDLTKQFINGTSRILFDSIIRTRMVAIEPQFNYEVYIYEYQQYTNLTFRYDYLNRGNPNSAYVRIWHDNRILQLDIRNACVTNWDDVHSPSSLKAFYFRDTSMTTLSTFALSTTVEIMFAVNCKIDTVLGLDLKAWIGLYVVNLTGNRLSTAARDKVINDLVTVNYPLRNNGLLALSNQVPPAAAVGSNTLAARSLFSAASWVQNY